MINLYATRAMIKDRLTIADTVDDSDIDAALAAVSREIDRYCGRHFYAETRTRYFSARRADRVRVDDLLSLTSLATDRDNDRLYSDVWTATDYELEPVNAPLESPPEPYLSIYAAPDGDYSFPIGVRRGVKVVGSWGYYQVLETLTPTLAEVLDTSETGVDVSAGSDDHVGYTLLIDSEQMFVTARSTNTLTVERGVNGTTAATHASGAAIQRYTYPIVSEACAQQAILFFRGYSAPTGELGSGEFSQQLVAGGLHPFVRQSLESFRRLEAG